jgi:RHS repeat-associated protein
VPRCISAVLFALIVVVHDGLDARTLQSAEAPLVDRGVRRAETTEPDDLNNRAAIRESGVYDLRGISGACYFGFRYYDPNTGQWLSREPLGESESLNLYAYCHNDPINSVDVLGLFDQSILPQMEVTGMLDDLKAWWESIWGGDVDTSKKQTGEVTGAGKGGFVGGSANLMTGGLWKLEENPSPASQFGIWGGRAWGGGMTALTLPSAGARAPALARGGVATYNFGGRWLGAQATVHGPRVLSNPWVQRGVGYGGAALAGGTFYGMTTNPEFAGEVHTFEQVIPGATGEGLLLGYRGLGMMGRDAKAAFQRFDYLSFAARANKRSPVQLVPESLYIVPPTTKSSCTRAWPGTWDGARGRYWTEIGRAEYAQSSGWYSQANILEMLAGRSPKIRAEVRMPGGMTEIRDIPIELHHYLLAQRFGSKTAHQQWNLVPSLPWSHASMDEFRNVDFELIRIISGPNSWTP